MAMSNSNKTTAPSEGKKKVLGGKYLTFMLAGEEYGLEILKVREIIGLMNITPVPRTPEFILGVINLRGKVIPVINLRSKFNMQVMERTRQTCIIVVDVGRLEMGILVDSVSEVMNIADENIQEPPEFGFAVQTEFILGMGKLKDKVTILLDISRVLTGEEVASLESIDKEHAA